MRQGDRKSKCYVPIQGQGRGAGGRCGEEWRHRRTLPALRLKQQEKLESCRELERAFQGQGITRPRARNRQETMRLKDKSRTYQKKSNNILGTNLHPSIDQRKQSSWVSKYLILVCLKLYTLRTHPPYYSLYWPIDIFTLKFSF